MIALFIMFLALVTGISGRRCDPMNELLCPIYDEELPHWCAVFQKINDDWREVNWIADGCLKHMAKAPSGPINYEDCRKIHMHFLSRPRQKIEPPVLSNGIVLYPRASYERWIGVLNFALAGRC